MFCGSESGCLLLSAILRLLMNPDTPKFKRLLLKAPQKIVNKTFYRFLFSFVAVVSGVLLFILVLGAGAG